jgi:phosphatidylcholine synthase
MHGSLRAVLAAGAVHLFTALGIVCALFALRATLVGRFELAFFWLGVAFFIDGIDGTFARYFEVKKHLPRFSGETLDNVIDYTTYVFVPALMLLEAKFITGATGFLLASLICVSSLYHFSDNGSKSEDHCFVGFPAIWNIVAFYIFALGCNELAASALIVACVVLTFVPTKWVHPVRVKKLFPVNAAAMVVWSLAAAKTIHQGFPASVPIQVGLIAIAIYGIALSCAWGRAKLPLRWD